jgi:hypothetical protein
VISNDFIEQLEGQLRAASQRRVRLELARVPRLPPGVAVMVVSVVIALAVAVPLLAVHAHSPARQPAGGGASGAVVVGCDHSISGQLPVGWRAAGSGTITTGPISWLYLNKNADRAAVGHTHFIEALAVVGPGRDVTVSILGWERRRLSLDYTSVSPRPQFSVSRGASAVTFRPCPGPAGQTQFDGGFVVSGPAPCDDIAVQRGGGARTYYSIPLGRSCSPPAVGAAALRGDGVDGAAFGDTPKTVVRKLDALLGRGPSRRNVRRGQCGIDGETDWSGLEAYFHRHRFVGYSYGTSRNEGIQPTLSTPRGLRLEDTVARGKRLYGSAFRVSAAQGGSWSVRTRVGQIDGFLSDVTNLKSRILTIEAGHVGCPALTP